MRSIRIKSLCNSCSLDAVTAQRNLVPHLASCHDIVGGNMMGDHGQNNVHDQPRQLHEWVQSSKAMKKSGITL
eukprot:1145627-Pelagomonas_calceolata.AAC.3